MKVTTLLDLAGTLMVLAAVAITVGLYFIPAGLGVFGLGLLGISWLLDLRAKGTRK